MVVSDGVLQAGLTVQLTNGGFLFPFTATTLADGSFDLFVPAVDPSLQPREGEVLRVSPKLEQAHLFDAGTGERLRTCP